MITDTERQAERRGELQRTLNYRTKAFFTRLELFDTAVIYGQESEANALAETLHADLTALLAAKREMAADIKKVETEIARAVAEAANETQQ